MAWKFLVFLGFLVLVTTASASQYQVLFSKNLGNTGVSQISFDPAGNIYVVGWTNSDSLPTTPGVVQPKFGGGTCAGINPGPGGANFYPCYDAFVMKLDPKGNIVYLTYLGGSYSENGSSIVADAAGNAYIAGNLLGPSKGFPTTPGAAYTTVDGAGTAAFVAKLNPQGTALLYCTLIPSAGWFSSSIAVDSTGAVYFTGAAQPNSEPFPVTAGAFQTQPPSTLSSSIIPVVVKINPTGSAFVYSTYVGGSSSYQQSSTSIAIDASGNAYITGGTAALDFPTTSGAFQSTINAGIVDTYVAKLNPSGSAVVFSTYLGGYGGGVGRAVRLDSQGNVVVLGETGSNSFPVTAGAFQATGPTASWSTQGGFLAKLNAQGSRLLYATYLSGSLLMDQDAAGNVYVVGTAGAGFPVSRGAYQRCLGGGVQDLFVAKFDSSGKFLSGTYLGGPADQLPYAIAAANDGSVYLAYFTSNNLGGITIAKLIVDDPQTVPGPCMAQAMLNAGSFHEGPISAGEMITLRGTDFGPVDYALAGADHPATPQLGGVRVLFDGIPAPLMYVQATQINAVVPWEVAGRASTDVHVEYNGASSNTATIPVADSAPGLFHADYVTTQGAILNGDGTVNSPNHPAGWGTPIAIFGTGGGAMSPAGVTGNVWPFDPLARMQLPLTVKIAGQDAQVLYAGAAPGLISGFFQINILVPPQLGMYGEVPIEVTIGGLKTNGQLTTVVVY